MPSAFAQDLIILDEGHNTQQTLRIPENQRREQGCVSIQTNRASGANPELVPYATLALVILNLALKRAKLLTVLPMNSLAQAGKSFFPIP